MSEASNEHDELVVHLANQIHRWDLELERLQRMHGIFAAGMVKLERYSQAMNAEVEAMKNAMAGITPHGFEPLA